MYIFYAYLLCQLVIRKSSMADGAGKGGSGPNDDD